MTFIGDRFVRVGHQWLDIVSGRHVSLRVGAPPASIDERERVCRERWAVISIGARLIDFGRHGSIGWFEAEAHVPMPPPAPMRQLVWPQVPEWAAAIADGRLSGHLTIGAPPGAGFQVLVEQLARQVRGAGFVAVRADAPIPFRLRRQLMHRHLVLLVMNDAARACASGWLAQLAMVSDRRHVWIERVDADVAAAMTLTPFDQEELIDAAGISSAACSRVVRLATAQSGGWPAAFVRQWIAATPVGHINAVRERAVEFHTSAATMAVARDVARAATYARRRRPLSESQWHSAAVAAASRRGDPAGAVRGYERWVERLVDEGRYARAIAVAGRALSDCADSTGRAALTLLSARAHLAAAEVTRAETLVTSAISLARLGGAPPGDTWRDTATAVLLEVMFWKGRWQDMRSLIASRVDLPDREQWIRFLDWADRGDLSQESRGPTRSLDLFRPRTAAGRGLSDAIAIAVSRSLGVVEPDEAAWLDDLVRREGLRGMSRFSQGKSTMQMLRDMAALLEIVQAAEDEVTGLSRVCAWVKSASGASGCAVVSAPGQVVAGDGLKAFGLDAQAAARWLEHVEPALDESEIRATASAPVRFAGATLAVVAGTGSAACGRAIFNAVQAAAAVCGSLVRSRLDAMAAAAHGEGLAGEILGASPPIRAVRAAVARVALAPFSVVIEGESGTGKELVARALHRHGSRRDRAFAALNCAALTDELVEAELFGHARGAFTHAVSARTGLFEEAHRGTLFLDEVGELSPRAQAKLLRALQEGEIRRVGENDARPVDVRVIAATNRPLQTLAAEGRFREDLMFRLSVVKIAVPPLRERAEDIPLLALEFWRAAAKRVETRAMLGPDAIALLSAMPWPGNVRQLQNAMAALSVAAPKVGRVGARLVRLVLDGVDGLGDSGVDGIVPLDEARRALERRVVSAAMAKHTGNRTDAARALGLSRQGLAKALRRLGLSEAGAA